MGKIFGNAQVRKCCVQFGNAFLLLTRQHNKKQHKMIKISFLGTNSGLPTKERNVSSISLVLDNETYLIDCGEATQHQVQKSDTVNFGKISKIFITHLHGDHVFGLPGLLASVSNYNNAAKNPKEKPKVLDLYGPLGIRKMLFTSLMFSDTHLGILVRVHELVPPEKTNDTVCCI